VKQWNILALGLVLLWGAAAAADSSTQALSVYEEGKRLYDARDYSGALAKFDEAAALEPTKARWQYNRGLALRKLNRIQEAKDALFQARVLEPEYKRAEIDAKLREMGASTEDSLRGPPSNSGEDFLQGPPSSSESELPHSSKMGTVDILGMVVVIGAPILVLVILFQLIRKLIRSSKSSDSASSSRVQGSKPSGPPMSSADLAPLEQRMEQVASTLTSVEHSLRLEEDADLRALLNQATLAEQRALDELEKGRRGKARAKSVEASILAAESGTTAAADRARYLFGAKAFLPEGERVGCYFCARPLANASFRMQVPLKRGAEVTHVLACPPCANMAAAGQPPQIRVRQEQGGQPVHWSELEGFDPYLHRHKPYPGTRMAPPWHFAPRSLAEVAALAAGGALAGGLAAYGVSQLLDLDGAREAAAAQAAAKAVAKRAGERREQRDWKDNS
jgi:tetratricopeptide (TPR) repeat protein